MGGAKGGLDTSQKVCVFIGFKDFGPRNRDRVVIFKASPLKMKNERRQKYVNSWDLRTSGHETVIPLSCCKHKGYNIKVGILDGSVVTFYSGQFEAKRSEKEN